MNQPTLFDRVNPEPCRESLYELHEASVARERAEERARLDTAKDRVLARLQQGPATNLELNAICFRFGARIFELKAEGYPITKAPAGGGVWVYALQGDRTR